METEKALQAARDTHQSILVTLRTDGKPQLSNVLQHHHEDGVIRVSTQAGRAKNKNLLRTPWAALHVNGPTFWGYAVLEGDVSLTKPAAAPDDATVDELVEVYRAISGSTTTGTTTGPRWCARSGSSSGSPRRGRTARCASRD